MPRKSQSAPKKPDRPEIIHALTELRTAVARMRGQAESIALVPTMGALHAGHVALVRAARRLADRVFVSIFVNPAQFAPNEDFGSYPRTWDADLARLTKLKVDAIWAPDVATMYPRGFGTQVMPGGPARAGLEDAVRPHFFGGVCTVVAKLLLQIGPDFAMFGEKDYQQLQVVTAMARDLDIPAKIVGVPTVRAKDGLALSSRNAYLSPKERAAAPVLHRVLKVCATRIRGGGAMPAVLGKGRAAIEAAGFTIDYLEARHARTLEPIAGPAEGPVRLLVAARIGRTRLIDNVGV
jgi:pantoate--beta-alanine ligase